MAGSLNKAVLIGNLGRDPEIRHTADGKEIANFSIATSETWKDRVTGEKKEKTEWHRIVVFNEGLVSVVKNYAKKGTKVYLEGNLQTRKWVDNLGQEKYTTEIVLQNFNSQFILLDSKGGGTQAPDSVGPKNMVTNFDHSDLDDEIPF
ncbi:single-stranded DNA-binding protein [Candidatus Tisiphia endosymbiont of Dascillus cervinus]|uniref:single-stranded DNA-binding protein n=1 Tax=Candidatus Tisiphia endosymbiont of Dascillus cervinus TaxID=3066253 RepID=UPI00312CC084